MKMKWILEDSDEYRETYKCSGCGRSILVRDKSSLKPPVCPFCGDSDESIQELCCERTDDGLWAVRPISWAGIWKNGWLVRTQCNSLAYFDSKEAAEDYVRLLNGCK